MIKTVKPLNQTITIELPEDFIGKQAEVIAFTIEEAEKTTEDTDKPITYFASEKTLAKDWLTPEEDLAWQDL